AAQPGPPPPAAGSQRLWLGNYHAVHAASYPLPPLRPRPPPAAFPTRRTAGDALRLLQLNFAATCRLPGVCRAGARTIPINYTDDDYNIVILLKSTH
uniref:Uncharacterized protein n=1 Tax=Ursus americanus TaxID=9643 RepID=A0A452QDX3_URSAM